MCNTRKSIILKIFTSFLLVALLPLGALTAYNDWANRKNEITGIVVMRREAEDLWKLVEGERDYLGKGNLFILTDGYGVRIAHATDRSLIFQSWVKLYPP